MGLRLSVRPKVRPSIRRVALPALALVGCLLIGAAVGVWLFDVAGGAHLYAVPRSALVAITVAGGLGVGAVVFAFLAPARRAVSLAGGGGVAPADQGSVRESE